MIDFEKFSRYSKPGPRYTSYPTAVEFCESFGYDGYLDSLKKSDKKLSLYLHLPFCRSACYFCGCNVVYTSKREKIARYLNYLEKEFILLEDALDTSREVIQIHFGGGTPTFLDAEELGTVIGFIKKHFKNIAKDAEISCEIDPRFFEESQLDALIAGGFNRLSFGVQDFDPKVQEAIHRIQSFELVQNAVAMSRKKGIGSINFDLIYGLPNQSFETFAATLEAVAKIAPDRLAVFNYAHVPWMKKSMRKIDETTLTPPQEKLRILQHTIAFLDSLGYEMIGMDHFAKKDDELFKAIEKGELKRNFQGYTTKGGSDTIGIGLTSIGEGEDYYAQNYKDMESYEAAIDSGKLPLFRGVRLSLDDRIRKETIMSLMCNFSLKFEKIEKKFGIDFKEYFKDSLAQLDEFIQAGLVEVREDAIYINKTGSMLVRNIVMPFDAYLIKHQGNAKTFSKTV